MAKFNCAKCKKDSEYCGSFCISDISFCNHCGNMLADILERVSSKAIHDFIQPERLSERTYHRNEDGTYPHLESMIGSDSLNSMET